MTSIPDAVPIPAEPLSQPLVSTLLAYYVLTLLTLISTVNVIDRQVMSLLAQPVKHALHLSDSQLGVILGPATGLIYAFTGLPLAMVAERFSRKWVIGICLLIFTFASAACGLVASFGQLLAGRVVVSAAESGTSPASQAIVSSLFPQRRLTFALSILMGSLSIGTFIAFVFGGWIAGHFDWRKAFFIVSAPGLLLFLLLALTVPRVQHPATKVLAGSAPIWATIRFLWSRPAYRNTCWAYALYLTGSYSVLLWTSALLMRSFHLGSVTVGWIMGITVGVVALIGSLILGWFTQRLAVRDMRWNLWAVGLAGLVGTPFMWGAMVSTSLPVFLIVGFVPAFVFHFQQGTTLTVIQSLAPPGMKSEASALAFLIAALISGSLGPLLAGVLSDLLHPRFGAESLRYVFLIFSFCWPAAAWFYWRASRTLHAGLETVEAAEVSDALPKCEPRR